MIAGCLVVCGITALTAAMQPALACSTAGLLQRSTVPLTSGTDVFQGISRGQQYLYLFDVATKRQRNLTKPWTAIYNPANAHFFPNSQYVVFTAQTCPDLAVRTPGCTNTDPQARTDAFVWHVGTANWVGLTTRRDNERYEDVIFSADGQSVFMKDAGNIVEFPIDFSHPDVPVLEPTLTPLFTGPPQASGPYPSLNGAGLYFWKGIQEEARIQYLLFGGAPTPIVVPGTTMTYFPVAREDGAVFVVAHDGHTGDHLVDQIYIAPSADVAFTSLTLNSCLSDNSDPAPVETVYILFSNTRTGDYRPYLGNISTGAVWALTARISLGTGVKSVLGMGYIPSSLTSR